MYSHIFKTIFYIYAVVVRFLYHTFRKTPPWRWQR